MSCKRWISCSKRIITFFVLLVLCTCIIFVSINRPKEVKAEPITGAVVITGAILAFLAACGVELTTSDMDTTTLQQCVEDMTADYTYDNKTGATAWYADAGTVANVISGVNAGDKTVILGSAFSQWLSGLPSFLENKYGLTDSSISYITNNSGFVSDGVMYPFVISPNWNLDIDMNTFNNATSIIPYEVGSSFSLNLSSNNVFSCTVVALDPYAYGRYGYVKYSVGLNNNLSEKATAYEPSRTNKLLFVCSSDGTHIALYSYNANSNGVYKGTQLADLSSFSADISSISAQGTLTDGYQDLQDAMDEALGRIANNLDGVIGLNVGAMEGTITQEDVWERIYAESLENSLSSELTGDYADEDEAKEELEQSDMPTTSEMTGNIVVIDGLEDFFPFCIPFDLYEVISVLNVPAVAPKFEWTMNFAGIFDDYEIEIDLSDWDTVARVFRVMVVIAFLVFLILKTRDLIRG